MTITELECFPVEGPLSHSKRIALHCLSHKAQEIYKSVWYIHDGQNVICLKAYHNGLFARDHQAFRSNSPRQLYIFGDLSKNFHQALQAINLHTRPFGFSAPLGTRVPVASDPRMIRRRLTVLTNIPQGTSPTNIQSPSLSS